MNVAGQTVLHEIAWIYSCSFFGLLHAEHKGFLRQSIVHAAIFFSRNFISSDIYLLLQRKYIIYFLLFVFI